jgi:hypothetical protein
VVAFKILPVVTIGTIDHWLAGSWFVVFFEDILDDANDSMCTATTSPAEISNSIVGASISSMTSTLHCIPGYTTDRGDGVARAHKYGISCMPKMVATSLGSLLVAANMIPRRRGKAETGCWHGFSWCFKRDYRDAISEGNETSCRASERMASKPKRSVRIELGRVAVYFLRCVVIPIFLLQRLDNAG